MNSMRSPRRRGAILLIAIAILGIVATVATVSIRSGLQSQRQARVAHAARQAERLAATGLRVAALRRDAAADFRTETWDASDSLPDSVGGASVAIAVTDSAITSTATVGPKASPTARRTATTPLTTTPEGATP